MFIPTIMSQGDPEQQAKWMPLCMSLQVQRTARIAGNCLQQPLLLMGMGLPMIWEWHMYSGVGV